MHGKGVGRVGKGITLIISNEDMDHFTKIIKSLRIWGVVLDGLHETISKLWNLLTRRWNSWYFIRNFSCFNVKKYIDWKRCNESRKKI